jgi:hypothetical protein
LLQHCLLRFRRNDTGFVARSWLDQDVAAHIGRKDDDSVAEVDLPALRVGDRSFIQDLKQDVGDILVCFLEFVKEEYRMWPLANDF